MINDAPPTGLSQTDLLQMQRDIESERLRLSATADDYFEYENELAKIERLASRGAVSYSQLTRSLLKRLILMRGLTGWHFQSSKRALIGLLTRADAGDISRRKR